MGVVAAPSLLPNPKSGGSSTKQKSEKTRYSDRVSKRFSISDKIITATFKMQIYTTYDIIKFNTMLCSCQLVNNLIPIHQHNFVSFLPCTL